MKTIDGLFLMSVSMERRTASIRGNYEFLVWSKFQKSAGLCEFSFLLWNKYAYEKVFTGIKIFIVKIR